MKQAEIARMVDRIVQGAKIQIAREGDVIDQGNLIEIARDELTIADVSLQQKRRAIVEYSGSAKQVAEMVAEYLPSNYSVHLGGDSPTGPVVIIIEGYDEHGWTLDGYVIPRLASGLIAAKEF